MPRQSVAKKLKPRMFKIRERDAIAMIYTAVRIEQTRNLDGDRVYVEDIHARLVRAGYHALYPEGKQVKRVTQVDSVSK